jgi:hypothetical protein
MSNVKKEHLRPTLTSQISVCLTKFNWKYDTHMSYVHCFWHALLRYFMSDIAFSPTTWKS